MPYSADMSRLRAQFPVFYRFAAYLALLAMFVPVVTGLVHHPVAVAPSMAQMMSAMMAGQPCPMEQGNKQDDGKTHKAPSCPICQSLHLLAGGYVPPAPVALVGNAPAAEIHLITPHVFYVAFNAVPQARPRAPPTLV